MSITEKNRFKYALESYVNFVLFQKERDFFSASAKVEMQPSPAYIKRQFISSSFSNDFYCVFAIIFRLLKVKYILQSHLTMLSMCLRTLGAPEQEENKEHFI